MNSLQTHKDNNNVQNSLKQNQNKTHGSLLNIFHFNDVYDVQSDNKQPKGGAAYFKSLLDRYRNLYSNQNSNNNLTLFSGDAFSPSLLSSQFQGRNMIKPLNAFNIDLACLGNHDLDYQLDHVMQLKGSTNFEWLLSNIFDKRTQRRLAQGLQYKIIQKNGIKIGIFSLAEKQWIDTLYPFYYDICQYVPYIEFAQYMVEMLKRQNKCDILIALTHMMKYNDIKLAQAVPEIDLILGGHDHLIVHEKVNNSAIIKSGTNFKNFSIISVYKKSQYALKQDEQKNLFKVQNKNWVFLVKLVQVNHQKQQIVPDPQLHNYIEQIYRQFAEKQTKVAIYTKNDIDLRFKTIRIQPSPFLQFIAAFYRHYQKADCAFLNSGNFRADLLIPKGPITYGTLTNIIEDEIVVKLVPGKDVYHGLQNMVSMYPNLSGRNAALSGLSFTWDSSKQPFHRVLKETILINKKPLQDDKIYRVCLHSFSALGGDGYSVFKQYPFAEDYKQIQNRILVRQLLNPQSEIVKCFRQKYPQWAHVVQIDDKKYLQVDVKCAKNIKMI